MVTCSVCLPVFNEEEALPSFLQSLSISLDLVEQRTGIRFDVVAVDDGSNDDTLRVLCRYADKDSRLSVYALAQNSGHQAAILCGLKHAKGDLIITMDSDGQDPPESIDDLITAYLETGHEIVLARRRTRKDKTLKKLTAWLFYRFLTLLGLPLESRDAGDFRLISKRVRDFILQQPNSLQYIRGQLFTLKTPVRIISIDRKERIAGKTKYSLPKMLKLAISSAYVVDPLRIAQIYVVIAMVSMLLSLAVSLAFVILKIWLPAYYSSGVTTLALLTLILFTIVISMIAFQSIYMSLLIRSLRNEPPYIERDVAL